MKPKFRARLPWLGGDLQTLRNRLVHREEPLPGEATPFRTETPDGDTLTGTLHRPETRDPKQPLVVLFHGLTGSEDSAYMRVSARHHLRAGRAVLRMNLRGAGSSEPLCKDSYSGASWPDVLTLFEALEPALTAGGIFAVGYSMGGNILLNALPELPGDSRCIGAATVSAPIVPAQASRRLMAARNRIYQRALLAEMKQTHLARPEAEDPEIREAIESADSIWTFDDRITGPRNGFSGAEEYYEGTAGVRKIAGISVPLLLIHALNDPWIPATPYLSLPLQQNVTVMLAASGGHVGFHGHEDDPWHDMRISEFIEGLDGP